LRKDIDEILSEKGVDGMLLYSESYKDVNMYYLTKFLAPDPFIFVKRVDDDPLVVINQMEFSRAQKESAVKNIRSYFEYDYVEIVKSAPNPKIGIAKFVASVAKKELDSKSNIYVPPNFPTAIADVLRHEGLKITPLFDVIEKARVTKEPDEVEEVKKTQEIAEKVTAEAIELIANTDVASNGVLLFKEDGKKEPLTAGKLRALFGHRYIDNGFVMEEETIIACGPKGADPHYRGNAEDELKANQPIILDVFPRNQVKRYWSDMTRTIVKGKASPKVKEMFEVVLEARDAALDALHAGVLGSDMQNLVCDIIEKHGYETIRGGKQIVKGYTHSLGHGVGLEIHEEPSMSEFYKLPLQEHSIVTVEPGLYDPAIGGVRIEDIVEVTKRKCKNLTKMEICLEI